MRGVCGRDRTTTECRQAPLHLRNVVEALHVEEFLVQVAVEDLDFAVPLLCSAGTWSMPISVESSVKREIPRNDQNAEPLSCSTFLRPSVLLRPV